mmetsp:Transcript_12791/g.31406  ORF Transcript_12791/g.31406 Transcript_12791/m.31406 type:complete len:246 (-) Transcript_12791:138-875(-)
MGCCASSHDHDFSSDAAVRPVTKSNREGAYRVKENSPEKERKFQAELDENTRAQPLSSNTRFAERNTQSDTTKTSGASSHIVPKDFANSNALSSIYDNPKTRVDASKNHDEEIKAIMTALDKGGTKEEVAKLESRLSFVSKQISSVKEEKKSKMGVVGTNVLAPIQEDPQNQPAVVQEDLSSESSSDEEEESSSSESESNLPALAPAAKYEMDGKYTQLLKNPKRIDALEALTLDLPKLRPYSVA